MRGTGIGGWVCFTAFVFIGLAGCGGKKVARRQLPNPPSVQQEEAAKQTPEPANHSERDANKSAKNGHIPPQILYTETGLASWYGTVYHNRHAANGEIYDQNGLTAAHKTLPLNTLVRVTNLLNNKDIVVRVTDRGPFVGDRIIDLSLGAAKAIGLYLPGIARVRVEVLESPKEIASGGRWCVQIGAFDSPEKAAKLREKLGRRYQTARIQQFTGPTGEWLRVRVLADDKQRAYALARETEAHEGIFVVRLD